MEKKKTIAIIKLGRSITTTDENKLDQSRFNLLAKQIEKLHEGHIGIVLVVSGAIISGKTEFISTDEKIIKNLYAALGQAHITSSLYTLFSNFKIPSGQMLLTKNDLINVEKKQQIRKVLLQAVNNDIVMIINENDVVDLNSFSGNDILAVKIAKLIQANILILLTDVEGIYDKKMKVISRFQKKDLKQIAKITKNNLKDHVGGIEAKIKAAFNAKSVGIETIIAHGEIPDILLRLLINREQIGTTIV